MNAAIKKNWSKDLNRQYYKRRNRNSQYVYEKGLDLASNQRNSN